MKAIVEIAAGIAMCLCIFGIFIAAMFIPFFRRNCGESYAIATKNTSPLCGPAKSVAPVGSYVRCVGGVCGGPGGKPCYGTVCAPIGTCPSGGQCYRHKTTVGRVLFSTTGRILLFVGVCLVALVVGSFFIYSRHSRRWYLRHTYKTQAPCADLKDANTMVYEPVQTTCAKKLADDSSTVKCVCNNNLNLSDGTECTSSSVCPATASGAKGICYAQMQPCNSNVASHAVRHYKARQR